MQIMPLRFRAACLIFTCFLLSACSGPIVIEPTPTLPASPSPAPSQTPSPAPSQTDTAAPNPSPTPAPTEIPSPQICSPLEGYSLEQLPDIISNPYHPPPLGSDDPHHGVDFADRGPFQVAIRGMPVHAVLNGRVVSVLFNRFPYGNAVLIETSLEDLPDGLPLLIPEPVTAPIRPTALTCPTLEILPAWNHEKRSLYLLYAHLDAYPNLQPSDEVSCGDRLGEVGDSGNALNPHLHLEARVGPAGASIPSMAHYDTSATIEEMYYYCAWRVSGQFQLMDPMLLFKND
jgi:murein DD-endopeptidase MepM/ murein hydrolase activator NlpD